MWVQPLQQQSTVPLYVYWNISLLLLMFLLMELTSFNQLLKLLFVRLSDDFRATPRFVIFYQFGPTPSKSI